MELRRAYYLTAPAAAAEELPLGVLDFDLVTPHRDNYGTVLEPMGAEFHSEARPWLDTHQSGSVKNVLGAMTSVVEQSPERFRVRVQFNMDKPDAAQAYRDHKAGFLKGCSVGFDPVEGATRVDVGNGPPCEHCKKGMTEFGPCGSCFGTGVEGATLVYERYKVLEGSSCATPSNPMALCVRAAQDGIKARKIVAFSGENPYMAAVHHSGWDIVEEDAFLAMFPTAKAMTLAELETAVEKFNAARSTRYHVISFARKISLRLAAYHPSQRDASATNFAFTPGVFNMKPEHRMHHRYMIGDHLGMAEGHMRLMGEMEQPEARKFHRDAAMSCMSRAMSMSRMLIDSMAEGHEDAPEDAALVASMVRSAPAGTDEEMAKEWAACQRAALPHAEQTWAEVGQKLAKTPADLRVRFAAMTTVEAAHKKMITEQRSAVAKTEESDRKALVLEIADGPAGLDPGLEAEMFGFDPVGYERDGKANVRSGRPWSLERIRTFRLQVEGAVAQVTRTAQLRDAKTGEAKTGDLVPPTPQTRTATDPALDGAFQLLAQRGGVPVEKIRAMASQGSRGAVTDNAMSARLTERRVRPLSPDSAPVVVNGDNVAQPADHRFKVG